jgi:hypothetical protein
MFIIQAPKVSAANDNLKKIVISKRQLRKEKVFISSKKLFFAAAFLSKLLTQIFFHFLVHCCFFWIKRFLFKYLLQNSSVLDL